MPTSHRLPGKLAPQPPRTTKNQQLHAMQSIRCHTDGSQLRCARPPEEDLGLDEPALAHRNGVCVAVAVCVLRLMVAQNEHVIFTRPDDFQYLLRVEPVDRGETGLQECRLVDVVVLRAGEGEVVRQEPLCLLPILSQARVEESTGDVRGRPQMRLVTSVQGVRSLLAVRSLCDPEPDHSFDEAARNGP